MHLLKGLAYFNRCLLVKYSIQIIATEDFFAIFHSCLINLMREIVGIVALVQWWSNAGMSTSTFPPTTGVGQMYPC